MPKIVNICKHGKQKYRLLLFLILSCKECGGSRFCSHGIQKSSCKEFSISSNQVKNVEEAQHVLIRLTSTRALNANGQEKMQRVTSRKITLILILLMVMSGHRCMHVINCDRVMCLSCVPLFKNTP
jgi:hypothetical protein